MNSVWGAVSLSAKTKAVWKNGTIHEYDGRIPTIVSCLGTSGGLGVYNTHYIPLVEDIW